MGKLSIVIPVFNEERRLPETIKRIEEFQSGFDHPTEIIFVDDGSADRSGEILKVATGRRDGWRLVSYSPNAGKGYAVRRGIMEATGTRILISDADLSTPLIEIESLLAAVKGADIVIGSRAVDETSVKLAQPSYRQSMGKTFNRLMRMITGLPFRDTQCGFKLFSVDAAKTVAHRATVDRFAWDVEFLMLACREGYRIEEVPVLWFNSPESRVRIVRDSFRMLVDLVRMRIRIGSVRCADSGTAGSRRPSER